MIIKQLPSYKTLMEKAKRYPSMNIEVTEAYMHVLRAVCALHHCVERKLAGFGLSYRRFMLLGLLSHEPEPVPVCKLAEKAGVTTPTISDVLTGMVRDGLVERIEDFSDKRRVRIVLTPAGQRVLDDVLPKLFGFQTAVMAGLDDAELRALVALLSKVRLDAGDCFKEPRPQCNKT